MKIQPSFPLLLLLVALAPLVTSCASNSRKQAAVAAASGDSKTIKASKDGKTVSGRKDDLEEYSAETIADPIEPVNRVTFWVNHQLYTFVLRPVSNGYEFIIPKVARDGIYNAFENVKFPVRFVNNVLQGNVKRAGYETGKFVVNSVAGIGGLGRPAEHIPALANIPPADTGQTFAKWGIGHGPYLVLPLLGPSSVRDGVGLAGDYALNPVTWVSICFGGWTWTLAIPCTNTARALPVQLDVYDAATKNSLDRYLAARSAYVQYRAEVKVK